LLLIVHSETVPNRKMILGVSDRKVNHLYLSTCRETQHAVLVLIFPFYSMASQECRPY